MVAQENGVSYEMAQKKFSALHDEIVKAEDEPGRLRTAFENVRSGLRDLENMGKPSLSFEDAADQVRKDHAHLFQKLSQ